MDWNEAEDRQARISIVELLVALAFLADCVCSRSSALRRLILWILTPAETVARNLVLAEARAAGGPIPALPEPMAAGDSVADAMRLAACFRALAIVLRQLPMRPSRVGGWLKLRHTPLRQAARILLDKPSGPLFIEARPFDTS